MEQVQVLDKTFEKFIDQQDIYKAVNKIATKMNEDFKDKDVIFMGILNGVFMFASDLYKQITLPSMITFVKVASYTGTTSSGKVERLIGINENISGKTVVILEDIIDTGNTMQNILKQLKGYEPKEIKIATILFKPNAFTKDYKIDYIGIEIPNDFVLGYGLDYDGFGRNLKHLYKLKE